MRNIFVFLLIYGILTCVSSAPNQLSQLTPQSTLSLIGLEEPYEPVTCLQ